jgi:hypothetical protein
MTYTIKSTNTSKVISSKVNNSKVCNKMQTLQKKCKYKLRWTTLPAVKITNYFTTMNLKEDQVFL